MSNQYELWNRTTAAIGIFLYGVLFLVVLKLIDQIENPNYLIGSFAFVFIIFPTLFGLIIDSLVGPLHSEAVPIIAGVGILHRYVAMVPAFPSVFIQYGSFAAGMGIVFASIAEFFYDRLRQFLPTKLTGNLSNVDSRLDKKAISTSDTLFFISNKGILYGFFGLLIHSMIIYLLIR